MAHGRRRRGVVRGWPAGACDVQTPGYGSEGGGRGLRVRGRALRLDPVWMRLRLLLLATDEWRRLRLLLAVGRRRVEESGMLPRVPQDLLLPGQGVPMLLLLVDHACKDLDGVQRSVGGVSTSARWSGGRRGLVVDRQKLVRPRREALTQSQHTKDVNKKKPQQIIYPLVWPLLPAAACCCAAGFWAA